MGKTAIILGATGLTGRLLLNRLLADDRYNSLKIFVRSAANISHPKLIEKVGDLLNLEAFKDDFYGDEVYCCIGTTAKKTPNKDLYRQIDYGIPVSAAKLCKVNNINTLVIISALGADSSSKVFYNKTKGEMEGSVLSISVKNTYILRPSIIDGIRNENRFGEKLGIFFMRFVHSILIGKLRKYKAISPEVITQAMINIVNDNFDVKIIESDRIQEIGNQVV